MRPLLLVLAVLWVLIWLVPRGQLERWLLPSFIETVHQCQERGGVYVRAQGTQDGYACVKVVR